MITEDIMAHYSVISDQINSKKLKIILLNLEKIITNNISGDIVEFGCYVGTTSLFLQRLILSLQSVELKKLYLYDSFLGLPAKSNYDLSMTGEHFKKGELYSSKSQIINNFKKASLSIPVIKKSWFDNLVEKDIPEKICFGFLDGDFYDSILDSLKLVWPKLTVNGQVIIDDYGRADLPGVEKAVSLFLSTINNKFSLNYVNNLAIINKRS